MKVEEIIKHVDHGNKTFHGDGGRKRVVIDAGWAWIQYQVPSQPNTIKICPTKHFAKWAKGVDIKQPICGKCKHIDFHEPSCPASVRHILSVKDVGVVGCKWFKDIGTTASLSAAEAEQGVSNLEPL